MNKPKTKEYHLNHIEFPIAAESRELTIINIENLLKDEIQEVFTEIKKLKADGKNYASFSVDIDTRTIYYLECKGYEVKINYRIGDIPVMVRW